MNQQLAQLEDRVADLEYKSLKKQVETQRVALIMDRIIPDSLGILPRRRAAAVAAPVRTSARPAARASAAGGGVTVRTVRDPQTRTATHYIPDGRGGWTRLGQDRASWPAEARWLVEKGEEVDRKRTLSNGMMRNYTDGQPVLVE